jgi:NADP-dependent 3-hydroxy acid dehydrogenase YdfG
MGAATNLLSVAGCEGFPKNSGHSASKLGSCGLTHVLSAEARKFDSLASSISPALVRTEMTETVAGADRTRMLAPEDVAGAVAWVLETGPTAAPVEVVLQTQRDAFS